MIRHLPYPIFPWLLALCLLSWSWPAGAFDVRSFDPLGPHLQRLDEVVPGLEARGFLMNRSDLDLHGHSGRKGLGQRAKTWDFQMIEWDAEIELRYRLTDHLELVNIDHFLYDALYDWDRGIKVPKGARNELRRYHSSKRILRELYLKANYGDWLVQLGKQQVIWGKMDGKVIDIINPEDLREAVNIDQDDFNFRRLPIWMANATYFWSDYNFQFIWIPDFEPSVGPEDGSVWWFPGIPPLPPGTRVSKSDQPSGAFRNHEWAAQFNMVKHAWDISFIYFYTWDDRPTFFWRGDYFEPQHTRLHQFGGNVDKNFWLLGRDWAWRMEGLYTLNKYETTLAPGDPDGAVKKNNLLVFSSIETNLWEGQVFAFLQPMWRYQFGYDGHLRFLNEKNKRERSELSVILSLTKHWLDDQLGFSTTFMYNPDQGSWLFQNTLAWTLSNYLSAQIRYTGFSGSSADLLGMYDDWDNLGIEVKYSF